MSDPYAVDHNHAGDDRRVDTCPACNRSAWAAMARAFQKREVSR